MKTLYSSRRLRGSERLQCQLDTLTRSRVARQRARDFSLSPDAWPASKPAMLMSSSMPSQRMPRPSSSNRQFCHSADVDSSNLGYHASGTLKTRPSWSVTVKKSLETLTPIAWALRVSTSSEVLIPSLQKILLLDCNDPLNVIDIPSPQASTASQFQRI